MLGDPHHFAKPFFETSHFNHLKNFEPPNLKCEPPKLRILVGYHDLVSPAVRVSHQNTILLDIRIADLGFLNGILSKLVCDCCGCVYVKLLFPKSAVHFVVIVCCIYGVIESHISHWNRIVYAWLIYIRKSPNPIKSKTWNIPMYCCG